MDAATHIIVGAVAGKVFGKTPLSQFTAGVVSHFVADIVPHWDPDPLKKESLPYYLWGVHAMNLIRRLDEDGTSGAYYGALGGLAPDIEHALYHWKLIPAKLFPTHIGPEYHPHLQTQAPKDEGMPILLLTNILGLALLSRRERKSKRKRR